MHQSTPNDDSGSRCVNYLAYTFIHYKISFLSNKIMLVQRKMFSSLNKKSLASNTFKEKYVIGLVLTDLLEKKSCCCSII